MMSSEEHRADGTGPATGPSRFVRRQDVRLALLAGPAAWAPQDRPAPTVVAVGAVLEAVVLSGLVPATALAVGRFDPGAFLAFCVMVACAASFAVLPLASAGYLGSVRVEVVHPRRVAVARLAAGASMAVALLVLIGGEGVLAFAVLLGGAIGADIAQVVVHLGMKARLARWWRHAQRSPAHLGAVAALVGAAALSGEWRAPALLYLAAQVVVLSATLTCASLVAAHRRTASTLDDAIEDAVARERVRISNWIHDDVASAIRLAQLRLEGRALAIEDVSTLLAELDHHVRLQQLAELIAAGPVAVADLLQPYLRLAQRQGVALPAVPSYEQASVQLSEDAARRFQRAAAVLIVNAVQAGASTLRCELVREDGALRLEVEDDAGGFDPSDTQPGRGLERLRRELGAHRLEHRAVEGGTRMIATVEVGETA